jgi:hypothetical protein
VRMRAPPCQETIEAQRKRRVRKISTAPFADKSLDAGTPGELYSLSNALNVGKQLFYADRRPCRHDDGGKFAASGDSNPLATARMIDKFGKLLLGFEQSNSTHISTRYSF